jgi:hypothetical protein
MKNSDILREARSLIDTPEKWWDGASRHVAGKRCLIMAVSGSVPAYYSIDARVSSAADLLDIPSRLIPEWNDGHTHEEVLALIDERIAYWEAEENPPTRLSVVCSDCAEETFIPCMSLSDIREYLTIIGWTFTEDGEMHCTKVTA